MDCRRRIPTYNFGPGSKRLRATKYVTQSQDPEYQQANHLLMSSMDGTRWFNRRHTPGVELYGQAAVEVEQKSFQGMKTWHPKELVQMLLRPICGGVSLSSEIMSSWSRIVLDHRTRRAILGHRDQVPKATICGTSIALYGNRVARCYRKSDEKYNQGPSKKKAGKSPTDTATLTRQALDQQMRPFVWKLIHVILEIPFLCRSPEAATTVNDPLWTPQLICFTEIDTDAN